MRFLILFLLPLSIFASNISIQVLGSGGPEVAERASASYLIKKDGKALVIIDFGGGAFLRFAQAKAELDALKLVLFTHLHIDHVVDLPALMKAGYFSDRTKPLPLIGPSGNDYFPGFNEYLHLQFGPKGAYRYMSDILSTQSESFSIKPYEVQDKKSYHFDDIRIIAMPVHHGIVPAIAYRVEIEGKIIVFSGDTTAQSKNLEELSKGADILIAHHAVSVEACIGARMLHMTPQRISEIASISKPKLLLLSHRMNRTLGLEEKSTRLIQKEYQGKIIWAKDLMHIELP